MATSLSDVQPSPRPIRSVVVAGGTHGNEYTGVWCIKALGRQHKKLKTLYPTLKVSTLFANPHAHLENKRFIDIDLNRQFTRDVLCSTQTTTTEDEKLEVQLARKIDSILGPKYGPINEDCVDVVIDLHSTTTNMGLTIIVAEGDILMKRAAAYVLYKCGMMFPDVRCLLEEPPGRDDQPYLISSAIHGITIEVGPVPQGVLRHDAVEKTQHAIDAILEFLHRSNVGNSKAPSDESSSSSTATVLDELYSDKAFPSGFVPCFRDVPGNLGKIKWPCDEDNGNFPAWIVHKDIQDRDYQLIRTGDPIFVDLDGNVIRYDGSHGSPVYLLFINEGGYYYKSSGTGIGVALKAKYDLQTGQTVFEETTE